MSFDNYMGLGGHFIIVQGRISLSSFNDLFFVVVVMFVQAMGSKEWREVRTFVLSQLILHSHVNLNLG